MSFVIDRTIELWKINIPTICFNKYAVFHSTCIRRWYHFVRRPYMAGIKTIHFFPLTSISNTIRNINYTAFLNCSNLWLSLSFGATIINFPSYCVDIKELL